MAVRNDRDSAGRILRVLQDCDIVHMEAAIASLSGIRAESLIKPRGVDVSDVDVLERTAKGRVLSLSDHKRIARLQAALSTVANAYKAQNEIETPVDRESKRNLVCLVAGTAIMQAMRDCTSSRTNCCIWGPQAEKLHVLLDWMVSREDNSKLDFVRELLLDWIQQTTEKQKQLAACLVLFELLQRRRKMRILGSGSEVSSLLRDRSEEYLEALRSIIERGTSRIADSQRVKPSKLALIALETLALLCGDIAATYLVSDDIEKRSCITNGLIREMVEGIKLVLSVLLHWHLKSLRRQFLSYALQHLQSYATFCDTTLSTRIEITGETASDLDIFAVDVMCWHWEATAPLLCTRSDASSRIQTNQPSKVFARVLKMWTSSIWNTKASSDRQSISFEVLCAQLRYVCILMDYMGGVKGCLLAFKSFTVETKNHFVFFFVKGLSAAVDNGAEATVRFAVQVLRGVLLPSDVFGLLTMRDNEQELLSELLHICDSSFRDPLKSFSHGLQAQTEIEFLVADFIISRELFITELLSNLQNSHSQTVQKTISLVRTFLYRLDSEAIQVPLYGHWRKQLTTVVLALIDHENYDIRRLALSCIPSLDLVLSIGELSAAGVHDIENLTISSALGYLFATSPQSSLEIIVSWFIETCRFGRLQPTEVSENVPESPYYWNQFNTVSNESTKEDGGLKELQEKLLLLCFGSNGWSKYIQPASARSEVLNVILRNVFGSPRDTLLFRIVREFVACGWVDREVFGMMGRQLTAHMMNLERLSEELLDDTSSLAAKSTEGLLFSRLAPLLVLRMLPREVFGCSLTAVLQCGCEDLNHLNEYVDRHRYHVNDPVSTPEYDLHVTNKHLFHILACSVVDPLEFKEVKMLATEGLAKFPPPLVLPFAFAYLVAFLREATPHYEPESSLIVTEETVPECCGLVTAKLMVYYLNRVCSEDIHLYNDKDMTSKALVILLSILEIPCHPGPSVKNEESLLTDLQRGCIDCIALILTRLAEDECKQDATRADGSSLLNLLVDWIFAEKELHVREVDHEVLGSLVQKRLESVWSKRWQSDLPLQVRICCCNVLLSAISRSDNKILTSWKTQGFISRIIQATERCLEDGVVAGGLQVIFSFLYKASELISLEHKADLQLVRLCFEITTARLEFTKSETVAMSGLKVIGALIGKLPTFVGTLTPADLQRLIDRCLISLRDRRVSPAVSNLAVSLVQAMTSR